jgi:1,2-diacylglycerol 3-alpha-glucosyltransferase
MSIYYKAAEPFTGATLAANKQPGKLRAVGLITNLVPYHHARWEAFAATQIAECVLLEMFGKDEFSVLEYRPSGKVSYSRQVLFDEARVDEVSASEMRSTVQKCLTQLKPDVVCLNGYAFIHSLAALEWSIDNQVPTVICSESNQFDAARNPLKEWIKGRLVRLCDSGLAGGVPQAQYLNRLGLPWNRIFTGYDAVDNQYFRIHADYARAREKEIRPRYNLPEHYFLAVSRFTEKKNLSRLIQAYGHYREWAERERSGEIWDLAILGDGPLYEDLCSLRGRLGLDTRVHFLGAKPYAEVPAFYGLAEAFIHASTTEQWGLVVNEAMASGLPVLVSNRCGCVADLVEDGGNGFNFDPYDTEQVARRMQAFSQMSAGRRREMAENSSKRIDQWGPGAFAGGMLQAIEVALPRPAPKASLADKLLLRLLAHL